MRRTATAVLSSDRHVRRSEPIAGGMLRQVGALYKPNQRAGKRSSQPVMAVTPRASGRYGRGMVVLLGRHEEFAAHTAERWHPSAPSAWRRFLPESRVRRGLCDRALRARRATRAELEIVHYRLHRAARGALPERRRPLDHDTFAFQRRLMPPFVLPGRLDAVERFAMARATVLFCGAPSRHHALGGRAMDFACSTTLLLQRSTRAARRTRHGARLDAHHGNVPRRSSTSALRSSMCRCTNSPSIQGPGRSAKRGRAARDDGEPAFPAGTTGDVYVWLSTR